MNLRVIVSLFILLPTSYSLCKKDEELIPQSFPIPWLIASISLTRCMLEDVSIWLHQSSAEWVSLRGV